MKRILSAVTASVVALAAAAHPSEGKVIRISTDNTDLILKVGSNGRLYQTYLGPKLLDDTELSLLDWAQHAGSDGSVSTRGWEAYSASGNEEFLSRHSESLMPTAMPPHTYIMWIHRLNRLPEAPIRQSGYAMTNTPLM